jgi:hypothetical protein
VKTDADVVKPGGPLLPSRYEEVLNQRIAEEANRIAQTTASSRTGFSLPRWGVPVLTLGAGVVCVLAMMSRSEAKETSRVAFDRSALISTETVGSRAGAEDLIPPQPSAAPSSAATPDDSPAQAAGIPGPETHLHPASAASSKATPRKPSSALTEPKPECASCKAREAAKKAAAAREQGDRAAALIAGNTAGGAGSAGEVGLPALAVPAAAPTPEPKSVLNVGSRFPAVLVFPVNTAFSGAPVTAHAAKDIVVGDKVVIPAGTTLVGEAFATPYDDRAQLAFSAIVRDGKTIPFRGIALGPDEQLGVPGKVVRKASAAKKGVGRVLGAVGSAVSLGLIGRGDGVVGDAAATLAGQTAGDLSQLERTWAVQRSDKVVAVKAATALTIYVQGDVVMP